MIWRVVCCALWSGRTTWPRPNWTLLVFDSPYWIYSNRFDHRIDSNRFIPSLWYLSICLPVCLSVCLVVCLSVCLSVCVCLFGTGVHCDDTVHVRGVQTGKKDKV